VADFAPIPSPLNQQWKRIRYQLVPVITMGLSLLATAYLWKQNSNARDVVGEVHMRTVTASSLRDGVLLRQDRSSLYDTVEKGQIVARLDSASTQRDLVALQLDATRLRSEMPAEPSDEAGKLAWHQEKARLDELVAEVSLEADQLVAAEASALYRAASDKSEKGDESDDPDKLKTDLDAIRQRVTAEKKTLHDLTKARFDARAAYEAKKASLTPAVLTSLTPLRDALGRLESRLGSIKNQAASLVVHAPVAGKIVAVNRHAGQSVSAGEAIVTIASEEGNEIIAYVRQDQSVRPATNLLVRVRSHTGGPSFDGKVIKVGPAMQPVPLHQLRNPKVEEWGVPVTIVVPERKNKDGQRLTMRPGELMDVKFLTGTATPAAASATPDSE
jgi:multidrug resistance efflux pump